MTEPAVPSAVAQGCGHLLVTAMFEAIPTMYPDPARVKQTPRREAKPRASRGRGLGLGSMVNVSESATHLVKYNMPKMLIGMNQKVCEADSGRSVARARTSALTGE